MRMWFLVPMMVIVALRGIFDSADCQRIKRSYLISVEMINHQPGEFIFFRKYQGKTLVTLDSAKAGSSVKVSFTGRSSLSPGMYAITMKPAIRIDFFISDGEAPIFNVSLGVKDPEKSLTFKNSRENQVFADFRRYMKLIQYRQPSQQELEKMMKEIQDFEKSAPKSMLSLFIKSIKDPEIPEPKISNLVRDREQQIREYYYRYLVNHFFDNIDFSDKRILSIPVFEEKTGAYFRQIIKPLPDTLMNRAAQFLQKTKASDEVYTWSVRYL